MKFDGLSALVLGSTGLVGSELVNLLINDSRFTSILLIARRETGFEHTKITELIVDFNKPGEWSHLLKGDVLFSAFGTTIKKAGSKENQYAIDYTYQFNVAKAASDNGVLRYVLISSMGANANSMVFYSRIKGELDLAVQSLNFEGIAILRPSILAGDRKEHRFGEKISLKIVKMLDILPGVKKYRSIHAKIVAQAMINSGLRNRGINIFNSNELFQIAQS